jgi:thiol-disulfide isomerase/thioredoxin
METPVKYGVRSIPQLLAVDENDKVVASLAGGATKEQILDMVGKYG